MRGGAEARRGRPGFHRLPSVGAVGVASLGPLRVGASTVTGSHGPSPPASPSWSPGPPPSSSRLWGPLVLTRRRASLVPDPSLCFAPPGQGHLSQPPAIAFPQPETRISAAPLRSETPHGIPFEPGTPAHPPPLRPTSPLPRAGSVPSAVRSKSPSLVARTGLRFPRDRVPGILFLKQTSRRFSTLLLYAGVYTSLWRSPGL